ncbi:thioredoxin [Mordavella massiliensis]|uniref:Thioredoxin n=1 Tax=Mordavella massiliensis TaxID=1871024 RepID=A0A938X2X8_9CLOT|nr:thioredoxin [Mordavella massiliensis]MBM6827119.1 thioredoxin [Mordavella massiliensis]
MLSLVFLTQQKTKQTKTKEDTYMSAIHINKENFQQEVLHSAKPVLVDFWASWCGPCQMVLPIMDEIADERSDIKVCKINVDEQKELARQFRVMSIPTLAVFKNGEMVNRSTGAKPKEQILQMI